MNKILIALVLAVVVSGNVLAGGKCEVYADGTKVCKDRFETNTYKPNTNCREVLVDGRKKCVDKYGNVTTRR